MELAKEGKLNLPNNEEETDAPPLTEQRRASTKSEEKPIENNRLNDAVRVTTHLVAGGDPAKAKMFENLIADTAKTTLQKQLSAQLGGAAGEGAVLPEEKEFDNQQLGMFAAKERWADLAFGNKGKMSGRS